LLAISLISLAAQFPANGAAFVVLDAHAHDATEDGIFQKMAGIFPQRIRIEGPDNIATLLSELAEEIKLRSPSLGRESPEIFVIIQELQRFKALRPDDEFRFSMDDDASAAISTITSSHQSP
jgi:S-DNA-T family DNA segregation ATPase FtsK/SpoIIIE